MRRLDLSNPHQAAGLESLKILSKQLKDRRKELNLTQREVAESSGVSVSFISKFERGIYPTRLVWFAATINVLEARLVFVPDTSERWIGKVGKISPPKISDTQTHKCTTFEPCWDCDELILLHREGSGHNVCTECGRDENDY